MCVCVCRGTTEITPRKSTKFLGEGKHMLQLPFILAKIIKIMWGAGLVNIILCYDIN